MKRQITYISPLQIKYEVFLFELHDPDHLQSVSFGFQKIGPSGEFFLLEVLLPSPILPRFPANLVDLVQINFCLHTTL